MLLGWDTDQMPTDLYTTTLTMYEVLKNGGLAPGGLNFDAKVRRGSFELNDLFYGHIAGMDAFAYGLKVSKLLQSESWKTLSKSATPATAQALASRSLTEKLTSRL